MKRQLKLFGLAIVMFAIIIIGTGCGAATGGMPPGAQATDGNDTGTKGVVNVFTARHYDVDFAVFDQFEKSTGIIVNEIKGTAEQLVERMKRYGADAGADLFITVDGGVLHYAKESGVLQPIESERVKEQVPKRLRDKDDHWVALTSRARVIVYAKDRVGPEQLSTYEALAGEEWRGKVAVRSSSNQYNQSLVAAMIELSGEERTAQWVEGVAANLARDPQGGDRDQAKAVATGAADVAIVNTYYIGQMLNSKDSEEARMAAAVGVFFPNQETTGTHLNISGIGLAAHADNKDNAIRLIEYMTSKEAQETLTEGSYEFPVNESAEWPELLREWGTFRAESIDFAKLYEHRKRATELMADAGWK